MGHRVGLCRPHGASSNDNDDVNDVDRQPVYADQVEPVDTEAEALLQYIATFNELMTTGKYKQAATHAANSPDGVLRTSATFQRFKGGSQLLAGRRKHHLPCRM